MPRGGKRPGAGAPRGNVNALKHGRNSRRLRAVLTALAALPEVRDFFLEFQRRQQRERRRAAHNALADLLASLPPEDNPFLLYLAHAARQDAQPRYALPDQADSLNEQPVEDTYHE